MYIVEVISGTKTLLREEAQTESEALLLSERLFAEAHKQYPEYGRTIATCITADNSNEG
jgi:hypothetical protein